ncbi:carbohydrate kinase family protein [Herbiconiux solani]|uniref:carbohydrate kinase family protein n=1 Tax=Herbiconiux solani TaxID=661329 RepID=UPI0008270A05|nr:PfkB family carbohydrate kinase [Herbiconiux solani]
MTGAARPAGRVVVFGDVIEDIIVTPASAIRPDTDTTARIERRAGGSAANAAAWFGELGFTTDFFGRVGHGTAPLHGAALRRSGVTAHLREDPELPTGTIVVILEADRTRTMLTERGANALVGADDVDRALFGPGTHLHFTGYSLFSDTRDSRLAEFARLIAAARAAGSSVSVNPGSAGFIADHGPASVLAGTAGATVFLPNLDEGRALTGLDDENAVLDALLAHYEIVALTRGRRGVLAASRDHGPVEVPAPPVDPIDTTGAGDAFSAGFLGSLLASGPVTSEQVDSGRLTEAGVQGVRCAAVAVTISGARPPEGAGAQLERESLR